MKKETINKLLLLCSILCFIAFIIRIIADFITYDAMNNSAPFYVNIIIRALEYLLLGIIFFIAYLVMKKRV